MIKKRIEYTFFILLNTYLSCTIFHFIILAWILMSISITITKIIEKYYPSLLYHDDGIVSSPFADTVLPLNEIDVFCLVYGLPFFSFLFKILIFPVLYKIKFFSKIKDFLEKFATDKIFSIKLLFSVLIFDIIVCMLTVFFRVMYFNSFYMNETKECFWLYLFTFGGVLPCYLSFLLWYKWTHRKKRESV